jgi:hypothetical protein
LGKHESRDKDVMGAERFYIQHDAGFIDALHAYSVTKTSLDRATGLPAAGVGEVRKTVLTPRSPPSSNC